MSEPEFKRQRDDKETVAVSEPTNTRISATDLEGGRLDESLSPIDKSAQAPQSVTDRLASLGYWPARARKLLSQKKYALAAELCREHLDSEPEIVSGRVIYGVALYHAGQTEPAAEQFFSVLSRDPDNLVALKYLGDIKFGSGDEIAAMTYYQRVQAIDPNGRGLQCIIRSKPVEQTRTVTLKRPAELPKPSAPLRNIPFYTETLADLYMAQGYPRLAAEVYRVLHEKNQTPRLAEKLAQAEQSIRQKER